MSVFFVYEKSACMYLYKCYYTFILYFNLFFYNLIFLYNLWIILLLGYECECTVFFNFFDPYGVYRTHSNFCKLLFIFVNIPRWAPEIKLNWYLYDVSLGGVRFIHVLMVSNNPIAKYQIMNEAVNIMKILIRLWKKNSVVKCKPRVCYKICRHYCLLFIQYIPTHICIYNKIHNKKPAFYFPLAHLKNYK